MSQPTKNDKAIQRVDRSPLNPKVWCVQLECGHDLWLYSKPRKKSLPCERCDAKLTPTPSSHE